MINSIAQEEQTLRTGITSIIIPKVLDFEHPLGIDREKTKNFREAIGLTPDDVLILQPIRVIQRKGIEHAIGLVKNWTTRGTSW